MSKSLLIVGAGPAVEGNRRLPRGYDSLWTFLSAYRKHSDLKKANVVWDCHDLDECEGDPLYLYDIRNANISHPMIAKYGPRFSSQIAWMIAKAIEAGFTHIGLYRLMNHLSEEYFSQVPDIMYFIGWGRSKGVTFSFDPTSVLCVPQLYGLEEVTDDRT